MDKLQLYLVWLCLILSFSLKAEDNLEIRHYFMDAEEYEVKYYDSKAYFAGLDKEAFINYYANKEEISPEAFGAMINGIGNIICHNLSELSKKEFSLSSISDHKIIIELLELSPKAGLKIRVISYIEDDPEHEIKFILKIPEGRWNTFDILLRENLNNLSSQLYYNLKFSELSNKGEGKIKTVRDRKKVS